MYLTGADVLLESQPNIYLQTLSKVFDGVVRYVFMI